MGKILTAIAFLKELFDLIKMLFASARRKKQEKIEGEIAEAIEKRDARKLGDELRKL